MPCAGFFAVSTPFTHLRMLQCADSSFPSGSFAFSNGLETLAAEGKVKNSDDIAELLNVQLLPRWLDFDRWFVAKAYECSDDLNALIRLDRDCHVQNATETLAAGSRRIGRSLLRVHERIGTPGAKAFREAIDRASGKEASGYEPVVQGLVGAGVGLDRTQTELGAVHSFLSGTVSAAVRLGRLGAIDAQVVLADVAATVAERLAEPLSEFAFSFAPVSEIAAQRKPIGDIQLFAS